MGSDVSDLDNIDMDKALKLMNFYELVEGRPPFHLEEFDEKARVFEERFTIDRLMMLSLLSVLDISLSIILFKESLGLCLDNPGLSWNAHLYLINMVSVLLQLFICVCAFQHALFTDHPLIYLGYVCFIWMQHSSKGFYVAMQTVYNERKSRAVNIPEESMCRIINGFFASNRFAIMFAMCLKFHKHAVPSVAAILEASIVSVYYIRVLINQIFLCLEMQDTKKHVFFGFLQSWLLRGNAQIYVLPIVMSVLIWENMNGQGQTWLCTSAEAPTNDTLEED